MIQGKKSSTQVLRYNNINNPRLNIMGVQLYMYLLFSSYNPIRASHNVFLSSHNSYNILLYLQIANCFIVHTVLATYLYWLFSHYIFIVLLLCQSRYVGRTSYQQNICQSLIYLTSQYCICWICFSCNCSYQIGYLVIYPGVNMVHTVKESLPK